MLIFELGPLQHRVETIGLAHSQYHLLPPMTVFPRRFETILVLGLTRRREWANKIPCAGFLGPIKYHINTRFLCKHNVNVKHYWLGQYCINNGVLTGLPKQIKYCTTDCSLINSLFEKYLLAKTQVKNSLFHRSGCRERLMI